MQEDKADWEPEVVVLKYSPDQVAWAAGKHRRVEGDELARLFPGGPEEGRAHAIGNSLTEAGALNLARLVAGDPGGIAVTRATAMVGVGHDPSANAASPAPHGALSPVLGESPHGTLYQVLDKGYPQVFAPRFIRLQMTATEEQAVFTWHEWGLALAPELTFAQGWQLAQIGNGAMLLNRKAVNLGPKKEGRSWVYQCSIRVG